MNAVKEKKAKKSQKIASSDNILSLYLRDISRYPLLSKEEEQIIAQAAAQGDITARNKLVNGNLRFVVNIAKKFQGQGLSLADLISEGNMGLITAAERFDTSRGCRFISYAVWWIRQAILKAICEKSRMIRLPMNKANELVRIEQARKYTSGQGSENEINEISSILNMDRDAVVELMNISREMVSLENTVLSGHANSVIGDFIVDERNTSPAEDIVQEALRSDIENLLNTLDEKEAAVISYRFGLGNASPMSLKEIGERLNLTKERIRQIEKKAVNRLKHVSRMEKLKAYVA